MATDSTLNERDSKLVQWLGEAHAKEAEVEADLTAHIALTSKDSYKKRLSQHLAETREHKRLVADRIKTLSGESAAKLPFSGLQTAVGEMAGKAVAAMKGQVGTVRAAVTNQPETHLRNAQDELREEHVEIAIYTRLETLATEVGDRETAQLARRILRDEERMAKFLDAELRRLVKDVVREEIPREQRAAGRPRTRTTSSGSRGARTSAGRAAARGSGDGSSRPQPARSSASASGSS